MHWLIRKNDQNSQSKPYEVGYYLPDNRWCTFPEFSFDQVWIAADHVHFLNGGDMPMPV